MPDHPATPPAKPNHMTRYSALVKDIRAGNTDLQALAEKHGYSQLEMARFREKPRHARMLRQLGGLDRDTADLTLTRGRVTAARSISTIAADTNHAETSRKASAELIRTPAPQPPAATPPTPRATPDPAPTPTPEEIQHAIQDLERRAAEHFNSQSPATPPAS